MGKNLKGREIGEGLCQRKDGRYVARFTGKNGKKYEKYFQQLQDAKAWLEDTRYNDNHGIYVSPSNITVDDWYKYWIEEVKMPTVKLSTVRIYQYEYEHHIKSYIGQMKLCDVKLLHCQHVINEAGKNGYAKGTIYKLSGTMKLLFQCAVDQEVISVNPCNKLVTKNIGSPSKNIMALTIEEQKKFVEMCNDLRYGDQYLFVLQTGLRVGELVGLRWNDIDFNKKVLTVNRTVKCDPKTREWIFTYPKTDSGIRTIPLTEEAIRILKKHKSEKSKSNIVQLEWADAVFLNRQGAPIDNAVYNKLMLAGCRKYGIRNISMHILRHTFATRCIEAGMKPKTLQKILGHANLDLTMNLYVHVTEDEKEKEIDMFANYLERLG